jgi:parvulin-like peptidyl-prolyl isomerase
MLYSWHPKDQEAFPLKHIALLIALVMSAFSPLLAAKLTNRPIALVSGETILLSDYQKNWDALVEQRKAQKGPDSVTEAFKKESRHKLLDQMVDDKILQAEAKKRKIRVPQRDLENAIVQVKARLLSDAGRRDIETILRRQMAAQGKNGEGEADISAAWKELSASNPAVVKEAEATFKKRIAAEGLDDKKFTDRIREQLSVVQLAQEIVRERTKPPSEEQMKDLFAQLEPKVKKLQADHDLARDRMKLAREEELAPEEILTLKSYLQVAQQARARHILLGVIGSNRRPTPWKEVPAADQAELRKKLTDLRKKIKAGADFAELAEQNSIDKDSAANGGDLGFFPRGSMVQAFEEATFAMSEGQVSDVVETPFGLHLIKLIEKKAATKLRFEQVSSDMQEYLFSTAQQKVFEEFVSSLRKSYDVKVLLTPEELAAL